MLHNNSMNITLICGHNSNNDSIDNTNDINNNNKSVGDYIKMRFFFNEMIAIIGEDFYDESDKVKIESYIIDNKKFINYYKKRYKTVLYYSVYSNNTFITSLLIKYGANLNYRHGYSQNILLMIAMEQSSYECFELLIKHKKTNVNIKNVYGETILIKILQDCNKFEYLRLLCNYAPHILSYNIQYQTLFDIVIKCQNYEYISLLINNCASLCFDNSLLDQMFESLLLCYSRYNHHADILNAIQILLDHGTKKKYICLKYDNVYMDSLPNYIPLFTIFLKHYSLHCISFYFAIVNCKSFEAFKNTTLFKFFIKNGFDEKLFQNNTHYILTSASHKNTKKNICTIVSYNIQ